jgi:hypothetical protein
MKRIFRFLFSQFQFDGWKGIECSYDFGAIHLNDILRYEDMLNTPTMYGGQLLPFGKAIKSLQIPIVDKNHLYDLW